MQLQLSTVNCFPTEDEIQMWSFELEDNDEIIATANLYDLRHLSFDLDHMIVAAEEESYDTSSVCYANQATLESLVNVRHYEDISYYNYFILDRIKVDPKYRHIGVGTAFMKMLIKFCYSLPRKAITPEILIGFRVSDYEDTKLPTEELVKFYSKFTDHFSIGEYNERGKDKLLTGLIFVDDKYYKKKVGKYDIVYDNKLSKKLDKIYEANDYSNAIS